MKEILFFVFTLLVLSAVGNAQDEQLVHSYTTQRLTLDDGLSQGSNYFRFEDSKGFMWLTGNDALNRYEAN